MKFLLLNQAFLPDVAATAQYLADLALGLAGRGHGVTVVAGRRAYDHPATAFVPREEWRGVRIHRVSSTGFGKKSRWRRGADFGSFLGLCALRLLRLPRADAVVALTSPPLISFLGAWAARLYRARFYYWVMDFNPDEAIAAGWLRPGSAAARGLEWLSQFSLRRANRIFALDRYMRARILGKGIEAERVEVLPLWSQLGEGRLDTGGREAFRRKHRLEQKFVVMYSGNHSPCHPLATLLRAAERLRDEESIFFVFAGGGSEFDGVRGWATTKRLERLLCLPYQALNGLEGWLSAADLQVVVMGSPFVGLVHPCKIYNILGVGAPVLYIGPKPSHISDILGGLGPGYPSRSVDHGDVDEAVRAILEMRARSLQLQNQLRWLPHAQFAKELLLPRLIRALENGESNPEGGRC